MRFRAVLNALAPGATLLAALAIVALAPSSASGQGGNGGRGTPSFAQILVNRATAAHPEVDELGILATTRRGCIGIASSDKTDIGEKCEADDIVPLKTGKPSVGKEGTGYDVSVLLHDAAGKTVGVLSVGFKGGPGVTATSVVETATKIAAEMAAQIPSKAKLLSGSM